MNSTSLIVPRDGIDLSAGTCCVTENEIGCQAGRTCCPRWSSTTPRAPSTPWTAARCPPEASAHLIGSFVKYSSVIKILTFALFDRAAPRTVDDLCASPWSLSHHLVKVNCRVRVVQVVVREEFRLVFVPEGLRTSFQVWITVTNLKKVVVEKENKETILSRPESQHRKQGYPHKNPPM